MKSLRSMSIVPANLQIQTERRQERTTNRRRIAMPKFCDNFSHAKAPLSLALLLFASVATLGAFAQESSSLPLVYSVENTAANYAPPAFPAFAQLPIIRPLTDPFRFADGTRDTSFASWERRRSEIKAAIEKYEIGPKPDCSDCAITATYTHPAPGQARGTLSVVVARNAQSLTLTANL